MSDSGVRDQGVGKLLGAFGQAQTVEYPWIYELDAASFDPGTSLSNGEGLRAGERFANRADLSTSSVTRRAPGELTA